MDTHTPDAGLLACLSTFSAATDGVVERVSEYLDRHWANLRAVYGVKVGSSYATHFLFVSETPEGMEQIRASCATELGDLQPQLRPMPDAPEVLPIGPMYQLTIYGLDRRGILAEVSHVVRARRVDILGMSGCTYTAPASGQTLFVVQMKLLLPSTLNPADLQRRLDELAARDRWHLRLDPVQESTVHGSGSPRPRASRPGPRAAMGA